MTKTQVAAMRDRMLQLRVGDEVTLVGSAPGDHPVAATIVDIRRRKSRMHAQIDARVHGAGVVTVGPDRVVQVLERFSFLAERAAAAGKVCTACKDWYPLTEYYRNEKGLFGRHAWCIRCFGADQRTRQRARRAAARASA